MGQDSSRLSIPLNEQHYTFIFIGKTGTGKSSLCNRISGTNTFEESGSGTSETSEPKAAESNHFGVPVTVVDTPGIMDTSVDSDKAKIKSLEEMYQAINLCPPGGKRAIILVLKYSDRFKNEEELCIYIAEKIFGDVCFGKCCIIIFTHGDLFDEKYGEEDTTFDDWCRQEQEIKSELGKLLEKCKNRILLFSKYDNGKKLKEQMESLLRLTDTLDESYTVEKFREAKTRHNRLRLESILPEKLKDYDAQLREIESNVNENSIQDQTIENLMSYDKETSKILDHLTAEDVGVFYEEGESSLFEEPKLRAKKMLELIHLQVLSKLKMDLTSSLYTLKHKVRSCKDEGEVSKVEEERLRLFQSFAKFGLIINQEDIEIDVDNIEINLQSKDLDFFQDVKRLIKEFEKTMVEKMKTLVKGKTKSELESELKLLYTQLYSIPDSDFSTEIPIDIKRKASQFLATIRRSDSMKSLVESFLELEKQAASKIVQCKRNKAHTIADLGLSVFFGAASILGAAVSAGSRGIVKVAPVIMSTIAAARATAMHAWVLPRDVAYFLPRGLRNIRNRLQT
ncbi:GTPase IMAP family member 7 [Biomphalaria pfeifferi]|uniref:GTPase IMAP family member 7 n=1 Tax=Biomphalaria pfeifferi TaxID=112525 RepID=A0AAD8B0Z6_BIOPF|nr:GTPase IMAP family member 7 [Biomphalaria pfeifferi]